MGMIRGRTNRTTAVVILPSLWDDAHRHGNWLCWMMVGVKYSLNLKNTRCLRVVVY